MAFVAASYRTNSKAPLGKWVCTRTSSLGPFDKAPPWSNTHRPDFCGQCVSYVTVVCPAIPVDTSKWKMGALVKGNLTLEAGTAIATFDSAGHYLGHTAIYESQSEVGLNVVDQWVTPPATAIHARILRFGAKGNSNNGDNFYVIE